MLVHLPAPAARHLKLSSRAGGLGLAKGSFERQAVRGEQLVTAITGMALILLDGKPVAVAPLVVEGASYISPRRMS